MASAAEYVFRRPCAGQNTLTQQLDKSIPQKAAIKKYRTACKKGRQQERDQEVDRSNDRDGANCD